MVERGVYVDELACVCVHVRAKRWCEDGIHDGRHGVRMNHAAKQQRGRRVGVEKRHNRE